MTPFRRACRILAALFASLPLQARENTFDEPYGSNSWWLSPACEMVSDPLRRELRPIRAGHPAEITYQFGAVAADANLRLRYRVRLTRPGDKAGWLVSWDNQRFAPASEQTWRQGEQSLDLSRYLAADRPLYVRLSLLAAARPSEVAVSDLAWLANGVERLAPGGLRLPRGVWVEPSWSAAAEHRWLAPLPAGEAVELGDGRVTVALRGHAAADLWLAEALGGTLYGPGRTRLARAATGEWGGSLWLDDVLMASHELPGVAVGGAVPAALASRGAVTALAARGLPRGESVDWIETGPLELRLLDLTSAWSTAGCAVTGALTIINHAEQPRHAQVTITVTGPGALPAPQRVGCAVPPGPWLLPVRLFFSEPRRWLADGTAYRLAAVIDDGRTISDQWQRPLALSETAYDSESLRVDGREFAACPGLVDSLGAGGGWLARLPANRAELELAAARRVPVVILADSAAQAAAARLEYSLRPPVVAVVGP